MKTIETMNKKKYQKPSTWVVESRFPQSLLQTSGKGIRGTRMDYNIESNTDNDWDETKNTSSVWN